MADGRKLLASHQEREVKEKLGKDKQEDLGKRPTLKFITDFTSLMLTNQRSALEIMQNPLAADHVSAVREKMQMLLKALQGMDDKFLGYEEERGEPQVDIKYKQTVEEKQKKARALEQEMRKAPEKYEKEINEIQQQIDELMGEKKDVGREKLGTEVTDINIHTTDVVDAQVLQKQQKDLKRKINKLCCLCMATNQAKLEDYQEKLEEINKKIAAVAKATEADKAKNRETRETKEEEIKKLKAKIAELKLKRSAHIETPIVERIEKVKDEFSPAEDSFEKAKAALKDAEQRALREVGREQIANLLLLLAKFLEFKKSIDSLYTSKMTVLQTLTGKDKDSLDSLMSKIAEFQAKLGKDQRKIEQSFAKFTCAEAAARTGAAIYRGFSGLTDTLKTSFANNSFVDTTILDEVIRPAPIRTPDLPRVSSTISTLYPSRSGRHNKSGDDSKTVKAASSTAAASSKRGSSNQ